MLTLNDGRSELWQWDTGRTLTVDADCSQVHFSNKVFGRSIDVDVVDGVAIIPDILLQTDKELTAWAFVGTSENGYTKISKVFKVNKRNKPADYVFTPTEQTTLGELIERLDKIEESQDPDAIKNAVDDYLANNPIEIDETDPTVPEWAKQPTKPSYTASEVGALPADTVIPTIPDNVSAFRNDAGYLTEHQDLTGYATERYVQGYAQPKGDYLTAVPEGYATEEFVKNKIAEAELGGEEVDLSGYAQKSELPTKVSQLENDSGYLTEHQDISGKLDANKLPEAINTALAQAKASGEFDGKDGVDGKDGQDGYTPQKNVDYFDGKDGQDGSDGKDGVSPTVSASAITGGHRITITDKNGTKTVDVMDGSDGEDGSNGKNGNGIKSAVLNADYTLTLTFDDGTSYTTPSIRGATGATGSAGKDGKTPVKGVDFWTPADQEAIVQQVIVALGTPVFGTVDANNNIILSGNLADGVYTLKYEDAEGNVTEIGIITVAPEIINWIARSTDTDDVTIYGEDYNGDGVNDGYIKDYRIDSKGNLSEAPGVQLTGYIHCVAGDIIRGSTGLIGTNAGWTGIVLYDADKKWIASLKQAILETSSLFVLNEDGSFSIDTSSSLFSQYNFAFIRFHSTAVSAEGSILTINQEIPEEPIA